MIANIISPVGEKVSPISAARQSGDLGADSFGSPDDSVTAAPR